MKQEINLLKLFTPRPRPKELLISSQNMLRFWGLALLVLSAISTISWVDQRFQERLLAQLVIDNQALEQKLAHLKADLARLQDVSGLNETVKALTLDKKNKQGQIALLQGQALGNTKGFSEKMTHLAERNMPGMWFKKLQFLSGGEAVTLEGSAVTSDLIPDFIGELCQSPPYKKDAFDFLLIELKIKETSYVDFILETKKPPPSVVAVKRGASVTGGRDDR